MMGSVPTRRRWTPADMVGVAVGSKLLTPTAFVLGQCLFLVCTCAAAGSGSADQVFSETDLARHKDAQSCYAAIGGVVYDFTDFLSKHPGGRHALLRFAGTDATSVFLGIHDQDYLEKTSLGFKPIGRLVAGSAPTVESMDAGPENKRKPAAMISRSGATTLNNGLRRPSDGRLSKARTPRGWTEPFLGQNEL